MDFGSPSVLIYGPGSTGKTVSAIRAFKPAACCWLALEHGAFSPGTAPRMNTWHDANGAVLLPPPEQRIECISFADPADELKRAVYQRVIPMIRANKVAVVITDTISAFTERYYDVLLQARGGRDDYMKLTETVAALVRELVYAILAEGAILIAIAHEKPPSAFNGKFTLGGPKFVQKNEATAGFVAIFDIVLRVHIGRIPECGADVVRYFECDPANMDYLGRMRDRYDVCRVREPLDLRNIVLRALAQARGKPVPPPTEFSVSTSGAAAPSTDL